MGRGLTRVPAQKTEQNWAERCAQKTEVFGAEPWQRRLCWPEGEAEEVGPRVRSSRARTQRCTSQVTSRRTALVREWEGELKEDEKPVWLRAASVCPVPGWQQAWGLVVGPHLA